MKIFKFVSIVFIIFCSFNYAQWTQIPLGTSVELLDVHFVSVDTGWVVGRNSTILKTTNGGVYWTPQQINVNTEITSVIFLNAIIGWGSGSNGVIIKTTNGGEDWIQKPSNINDCIYGIYFTSDMEGVAVSASWYSGYPHLGHILKTTDGGETWSIKITDYYDGLIDVFFIDKNQGWACGSRGTLYKTLDGGNTWNLINQFTGYWLNAITFYNKNEGIVVGGNVNSDIIYKSTDSGNTWTKMRESYQTTSLFGLCFFDEQIGWACGYDGVILRTTNLGTSWHSEETGVNSLLNKIIIIDSIGYCVGLSGTFLKCHFTQPTSNIQIILPNGGEQWETGSTKQIAWNSTEKNYVNIEYSYNNGASWNTVVSSYPNTGVYNWTVPNILSDSCLVRIGDYPSSYDISDSSFSIVYPVPVELLSFSAEVVDNYVKLNWTTATETNNSEFNVERRSVITTKERNLEWQTIGILNGNGTTTELQNYYFVDENISVGKYQYRLKQIDFNGMFEYSNTIEVEINPASKFSLEQNFPNPFNPTTNIRFDLVKESYVVLRIYDLNGREIENLIEDYKPAGSYNIRYEPKELTSGIYFYRLITEDFTDVKKMVFLK